MQADFGSDESRASTQCVPRCNPGRAVGAARPGSALYSANLEILFVINNLCRELWNRFSPH
jgi:hypothetical protein